MQIILMGRQNIHLRTFIHFGRFSDYFILLKLFKSMNECRFRENEGRQGFFIGCAAAVLEVRRRLSGILCTSRVRRVYVARNVHAMYTGESGRNDHGEHGEGLKP